MFDWMKHGLKHGPLWANVKCPTSLDLMLKVFRNWFYHQELYRCRGSDSHYIHIQLFHGLCRKKMDMENTMNYIKLSQVMTPIVSTVPQMQFHFWNKLTHPLVPDMQWLIWQVSLSPFLSLTSSREFTFSWQSQHYVFIVLLTSPI